MGSGRRRFRGRGDERLGDGGGAEYGGGAERETRKFMAVVGTGLVAAGADRAGQKPIGAGHIQVQAGV